MLDPAADEHTEENTVWKCPADLLSQNRSFPMMQRPLPEGWITV